jgi:hypothetical protein
MDLNFFWRPMKSLFFFAVCQPLLWLASFTLHAEELPKPFVQLIPTAQELRLQGAEDYIFKFENFPKNVDVICLYRRVLTKDPQSYKEKDRFRITEEGLIEIKGKLCQLYTGSRATDFARGERVLYRYQLTDGTVVAEINHIPAPFQIKSKQGTFSMDIELVAFHPVALYLFRWKGLEAGERLSFCSISEREVREEVLLVTKEMVMSYSPNVVGKRGGKAHVKISRESGDHIIVSLPWGLTLVADMVRAM